MKAFYDSTPLLNDSLALQQRFDQDGYVFLKRVVALEKLNSLRNEIVAILAEAGWLAEDSKPMDAVSGIVPHVEGEEPYMQVYDRIQQLESFHALPHDPAILKVMKSLLGETAFPHPLSIARLIFPENVEWSTPPHQDYPNNQGTEDLYACWIPLGPCPQDLGGLSILSGSHKFGQLPLEFALGPGHRQVVLSEEFDSLDWLAGDFAAGDVIVFHSLTVHRAMHNKTNRMRLSVDYRFQREQEPLTPPCLQPHFQRLSWKSIYTNWTSRDLMYYWKDKTFELVDWDDTMHDLKKEDEQEAIRKGLSYERRRERLRSDLGE